MELSFLIPVKNYRVQPLVSGILSSANKAGLDTSRFEILIAECPDDSATFTENNQLESDTVKMIERSPEQGRSGARNLSAQSARGAGLVFVDADSEVRSDYVRKYLSARERDNADVIAGGTIYTRKTLRPDSGLRWHYGKQREELSVETRRKKGFKGFTANNFMVTKRVFEVVKFDESIKGYGHEDSVFGSDLKKSGFEISHIDNPVEHIGLESDDIFIEKSREAVENLWKLYIAGRLDTDDSKLLSTYLKYGFAVKMLTGRVVESLLKKRIKREDPDLQSFDLLKLIWLCRTAQRRA